jgi:hypothetical protein
MRILTQEEYDALNPDEIGYSCFMGGSNCGAEAVVYDTRGKLYLFTRLEIDLNNPEFLAVVQETEKEANEFAQLMGENLNDN